MASGHVVIIEAFKTNASGGEAGIAEAWIAAILQMPEVSKLIIVTRECRPQKHPLEEVHVVPYPRFAGLPSNTPFMLEKVFFYLGYTYWLWTSASYCMELARKQKVSLALHVTFSNLVMGTFLWRLQSLGVRTACAGVLLSAVPEAFHEFLNIQWRLLYRMSDSLNRLSRRMRSTDFLVASTNHTYNELQRDSRNTAVLLRSIDVFSLVEPRTKVRRAVYVDRPDIRRKCSPLMHKALALDGGSPLPLLIFSAYPNAWSAYKNVVALPLCEEAMFERELAASEFVLSTSFRESGHSTVIKGMSAGAIPILTEIDGYDHIPHNAKVVIPISRQPLANNLRDTLSRMSQLQEKDSERLSSAAYAWARDAASAARLKALVAEMLPAGMVPDSASLD